ncbi:MAG: hypothetical protein ACE5E1_09485 [Phycisphaerae bacterium]
MKPRIGGLLAFAAGLVFLTPGCIAPEETKSINLPSLGDWKQENTLGEFFAYQNDQGLVAGRSLADIHFVPHSVYLSGTGEARLARYAELLADTGGVLHYDTSVSDRHLIEGRLAVARRFLARSSKGDLRIDVVLGSSGGRGMTAGESLAGLEVAAQPEPRGTAYHLTDSANLDSGD